MEENKKIEELQKQVEALQQLVISLAANNGTKTETQSRKGDVTIVHLYERAPHLTTHIELSNLTLDLSTYGEERLLSYQQFEELVGKYRSYFDKGLIALGNDYADLAKKHNVKIASDYSLTREKVLNLYQMSMDELTQIFNSAPISQQELICETWKRKLIEKDEKYADLNKVGILNGLTNGAFKHDLDELMGVYKRNK